MYAAWSCGPSAPPRHRALVRLGGGQQFPRLPGGPAGSGRPARAPVHVQILANERRLRDLPRRGDERNDGSRSERGRETRDRRLVELVDRQQQVLPPPARDARARLIRRQRTAARTRRAVRRKRLLGLGSACRATATFGLREHQVVILHRRRPERIQLGGSACWRDASSRRREATMSYQTRPGLTIHWAVMAGRRLLKFVGTSVPLAFWLTPSRCW